MSKTIGEKLNDGNAALAALLTYANGVTGADDTTLGDAVKTLADGYGGGYSMPFQKIDEHTFVGDRFSNPNGSALAFTTELQDSIDVPVGAVCLIWGNNAPGNSAYVWIKTGTTSNIFIRKNGATYTQNGSNINSTDFYISDGAKAFIFMI